MIRRLVICILGVYSMFLLWAISQESLSKSFHYPVFLQFIQSILSTLISFLYLRWKGQRVNWILLKYVPISICLTLSPVFAFASLKHISYPFMVIAKSCKLVPTILLHLLLFRRSFPIHKYILAFFLTIGICLSHSHSNSNSSSSPLGLFFLFINLILDGLANSSQDSLFASDPSLSGQQMMFSLSLLSALLSLSALILLPSSLRPPSPPLSLIPSVFPSLLQYSLTSALGQLFIFETLHHFGSLTLITITLTRKLLTLLLSVFLYNHRLSTQQWFGTAIVFSAISLDAILTTITKKSKTN